MSRQDDRTTRVQIVAIAAGCLFGLLMPASAAAPPGGTDVFTRARERLVMPNAANPPPANRVHYAHMGLEGRVARDGWGQVLDRLFGLGGRITPWVFAYDRDATVVAAVSADGTSTSPRDVLDVLVAKVEEPAP